jgi:amino-acid N-acetyltransferase
MPDPGGTTLVLRKARLSDIRPIADLIRHYAGQSIMLPRSEFELAEGIRDFTVAISSGTLTPDRLIGCAALQIYTAQSAEIRSLAVDPASQGLGAGRALVEALEAEAREFGLRSLFAFTYVPDFFGRLGYKEVERGELPIKAWKDCLRCPKFKQCDEIAVQKTVYLEDNFEAITHERGESFPFHLPSPFPIVVPHPKN